MKRVVYVSATNELGGSDASLFELVRNLDRARFLPTVVLPQDGPWSERYASIGVPVEYVPLKKLRNTLDPRWHLAWLLRAATRVRGITRVLDACSPAIVHLNTSVEVLAAFAIHRWCRRHGGRFVWHVRELELRPRWVERAIFGLVRSWADAVVAISTPIGVRFAGRERVFVIPNGIDLQRFRARALPTVVQSAAAPVVGWLGRVAPRKGLENAIEVFERVADTCAAARLLIVGSEFAEHATFVARLREQVRNSRHAARIDWRGATDSPERALGEMDLLLHLPDLDEGLGRVVLEAQACAVPVVTWPRGGLVDATLDGVTGTFVPVGDLAAAARAVTALLDDETRRRRMGAAATAFASERFGSPACARRVESAYASLAGASA